MALIVAGWIWQTHALGTEGWKELEASLARDPAFATVCAGDLLVFIAVIFL
ncbi:MAG: hypothetical protein ACREXM_13860 [Gammaproteobacteria bacterium]